VTDDHFGQVVISEQGGSVTYTGIGRIERIGAHFFFLGS
jgi:hypothetical protein